MKNIRRFEILTVLVCVIILIVSILMPLMYKQGDTSEINLLPVKRTDPYVVIENEPYYSETTYYFNKEQFLEEEDKGNKVMAHSINDQQYEGEFVMAVNKTVFVEEVYDAKGNTIESRLLTRDEINEPVDQAYSMDQSYIEVIGDTTQSRYDLDIRLLVLQTSGYYVAVGYASWNTQYFGGGEEYAEDSADDFMAITWGGNGELQFQPGYSFEIEYFVDHEPEVDPTICDINSYAGICWQFEDRIGFWGLGWPMENARASIGLKKTYPEEKGKETSIRLTYVHTYGLITPVVQVTVGYPSGLAGGLSISTVDKAWQIMVEVPDIFY